MLMHATSNLHESAWARQEKPWARSCPYLHIDCVKGLPEFVVAECVSTVKGHSSSPATGSWTSGTPGKNQEKDFGPGLDPTEDSQVAA